MMMGFGMLFWLVLIPLVVWAVLRFASDRPGNRGRRETPEEILDRRFAQGELDIPTYTEMRALVRTSSTHDTPDVRN